MIIIWSLILIHTLTTSKVYVSLFLLWFAVLSIIILVSSVINRTPFHKTLLYIFFALNPLAIFYFYKILEIRGINFQSFLVKFSRFVALIQLPIILLQKYGYKFLIKLNNSNQNINDYDSMFGSFFIKADHALGFFLLLYIINIIFRPLFFYFVLN